MIFTKLLNSLAENNNVNFQIEHIHDCYCWLNRKSITKSLDLLDIGRKSYSTSTPRPIHTWRRLESFVKANYIKQTNWVRKQISRTERIQVACMHKQLKSICIDSHCFPTKKVLCNSFRNSIQRSLLSLIKILFLLRNDCNSVTALSNCTNKLQQWRKCNYRNPYARFAFRIASESKSLNID